MDEQIDARQDTQDSPCPNFKQCGRGIWRNFKTSAKKVWINNYCRGAKNTDCVRRVLKRHGQEVPESLLPNGESLTENKSRS